MRISIHLKGRTVKALHGRREDALCKGDLRMVRRIGALLLLNENWDIPRIAAFWGVVDQTVYNWITAWLLEGLDSLRYATSPGRPAKLTPTQKKRLKALIVAGPEPAGYPTGCWTAKVIQDLIWREFHVLYDVPYLSELLHHLGFAYQKARFVSDHLDPAKRKAWIEQKWPQIVARAKADGALLLFSDEASFAQWGSLAYTWALVGEQPEVKTCGKRKAYKVFGLIDYFSGRLFYQAHTGRFTAESYCQFLAQVLAQTTQPIILIQDGATYHTAAKTQAFCAQHVERLTVEPLPAYSPDYNPIEHLWRNVRRNKTHNRYFAEFELLTTAVEDGLRHLQQHPEEVKQLMGTFLEKMLTLPVPA